MPYRLHKSLGYQLSITSRLQERRLDDRLKTLGLTRTTWCVLLAVGNEGLRHPSEIAAFVGIDRTATSRSLRSMEAAGLIGRQSGTSDRRTTLVMLTEKGRATLEAGTPFAEANAATLQSRITRQEHAALERILEKLRGDDPKTLRGI